MFEPVELPGRGMSSQERVYSNSGNPHLNDLLKEGCSRVLDIGCGAGDNAVLLKMRWPETQVFGVTYSQTEADLAQHSMEHCWLFNIEGELPVELEAQRFDVLIFAQVLEHLRDPAAVLARFSWLLCPGGAVLIAVPNVLSWRQRVQFFLGRFEYESSGVLDDTHLRFFTYFTPDRYLLAESPDLELQFKGVTGSVPLWWLRRHVLPKSWSRYMDQWNCNRWPNLFGGAGSHEDKKTMILKYCFLRS